MAETTVDDEARFRARTERIAISQTEIGMTIRASAAPRTVAADVDPAELPRITLDTREAASIPPARAMRADLAIVSTIGEGGMGRVHLARQRSLARDVAVKTLKEDANSAVAHALLREARVTGMLEHPGVIPVHALGVDDVGRPMLVMKRVDGVDLSTQLAGRAVSGNELVATLEALMQVCLTCEFAHSRGVVHRDIKPENIMVGGFGEVYLLDWGIATKLDANVEDEPIVGTPAYMAPEMVLGRGVDARTDVYLLGATLHEALTGRPRHAGTTMMQVARAALLSEPFAYGPDVPEELAALCNRATAKDAARRPPSAAAFRDELASFLRHRTARAIADAAHERLVALEESLAASAEAPRELARAYRLLAEARFGLAQSLEQDAADAETQRAMRRCAIAAIELELRQGHVDTADALLRELEPPEPELVARIAERRRVETEKQQRHERLASLERDLDPTENARQRTLPMVGIATVLVVVGAYIALRGPTITPRSMLFASLSGLAIICTGIFALRKVLLTNAFNRRIAAMLVLAMASAATNRLIGVIVDRPPIETLSQDLVLFAALVVAAAITLLRRLWICAVVLLVGCVVMRLWKEEMALVFTMTSFFNLLVGAVILRHVRAGD